MKQREGLGGAWRRDERVKETPAVVKLYEKLNSDGQQCPPQLETKYCSLVFIA